MQRAPAPLDLGPALTMEIGPRLSMHASPALLALTTLLPLSSQELDVAIEREMAENPALERLDAATCPLCGGARDRPCPQCRPRSLLARASPSAPRPDSGDPAGRVTPHDTLLFEARLLLPRDALPVLEFVVGSLDDRGFLPCGPAELARQLGVDEARIERVLRALREAGPPGIGARDARECLLLQLDRLESDRPPSAPDPDGPVRSLARTIVRDHLTALARGRFAGIARSVGASMEEVEAARRFIRARLSPYPGSGLPGDEDVAQVVPDVVVREPPGRSGELEVEVVDERRFVLRVDRLYRLLSDLATEGGGPGGARSADFVEGVDGASCAGTITPEVRRHVRHAVRRAAFFIERVEERNRTLHRVAERVVETQRAFVLHGRRSLRPLTRAQVAEALGVHESTVSRTTAGKHIMLPSGKVVPFRDFFDASLGVQDVLRELLEKEDRPLSDGELTGRLRDLGYHVARRTVAKYRNRLGVLPGALRLRPGPS